MGYCTRAQIAARLPFVDVASSKFDATVAEAIVWGSTQVDDGMATRYDVPFADPAPVSVQQLAADFAAAFVVASQGTEASQKQAETLLERAIAKLKLLEKNGIQELEEDEDTTAIEAERAAYHSGFGKESTLQGFWADTFPTLS